ncbi:hypothetical protein ACNOYE_18085 [Nannocystaceae bacterium ST9]
MRPAASFRARARALRAHWTLALALLLAGCGVGKGAPQWIGSDAALVRCTIAGRNLRLPRLLDAIPTPLPPTGLYAQTLDPIALDELGFERDRVVCATLQAPDDAAIEAARAGILELHRIRDQVVTEALERGGGCLCMQADRLDARGLLPGCLARPTEPSCTPTPEQLAALDTTLIPLREQLAATELPRVHWRLSGRTDRVGRFAARNSDVVGRHPGGSEVFLRGAPLPPRPGMALVASLLGVDGVVAVVRQDSGRALLVVRELDDVLVLDHFSHGEPVGLDRERAGDLHGLLGYLDDAQIAWYRAALAPPSSTRELQLDPRDGYLIELDHAGLERVDRAMLVMATLGGVEYDEALEVRTLPPLLVDRLTLQVPFGSEGERLLARLRLSDEGRRWIAGGEGLDLRDAITGLAAIEQPPVFEPAAPDFRFVLRGEPSEQVLFAGASAGPELLAAIEAASPGSVEGEVDDFEVRVPSGPLPGGFAGRIGTQELREKLTLVPHRLRGKLVEGGRVLALDLSPD